MPVLVRCPFHDDSTPSLALYGDHAYCFGGCGLVPLERLPEGYLEQVKREAERERPEGKSRELSPEQISVLIEVWHWQLLEGPRRSRLTWLEERGLDEKAVKRFRLGHSGSWFTIPVLYGKEVRGVRFRRDDLYAEEDAPKYRNPKGQPALLYRPNPGGWPLVVTEGEFDAMLLALCGCDAVTSTAGAGSLVKELERSGILGWYRRRGEQLHVAVDLDPAGEAVVREIKAKGVLVHRWTWTEGKDVSEALSSVPRERWKAWVRRQLREVANHGGVTEAPASLWESGTASRR